MSVFIHHCIPLNQRETLTVVAEVVGEDTIKLPHFGYMGFELFIYENKHTLATKK